MSVDLMHPSCEYFRRARWQVEIENDIDFPRVDLKKVSLDDGFTSSEKENTHLAGLMQQEIRSIIVEDKKKNMVREKNTATNVSTR